MAQFTLPTLQSLLIAPDIPLIHRDLSWLQFNERVLAEAVDPKNPLLERAKFLAISSSNLDEFFMVRLAALVRSISAASRSDEKTAVRLAKIRTNILKTVTEFAEKQARALDQLAPELTLAGVRIARGLNRGDPLWEPSERAFREHILPRLQPPEPFNFSKISLLDNLQTAAIYGRELWFRVPRGTPSVVSTPLEGGASCFFFTDELIRAHLGPAFRVESVPGLVRLTRDGDFTVDLEEEDPESIPDVVRQGLGTRDKGRPVRMQIRGELSPEFLGHALHALRLPPENVFPVPSSLGLHGLWSVVGQVALTGPEAERMRYKPLRTLVPSPFRSREKIFEKLRKEDILLHHPYDSFDAFVDWIRGACEDPDVQMIEQTVYRMDALSQVVSALKEAAKTKKVRVIIELRARFDELNNLRLSDELRSAGVEVAFGFGKLKLHAKLALVTRREPGGTRLYAHLSTGNYNATTARQYTDLSILTSNQEICADIRTFFDSVWARQIPTTFKHLLSAPTRLHRRLLSHIQQETEAAKAGRKARIVAKVNALVDEVVIAHLYQASLAGVQVDLIVRGACSLVPGVKGLSENIRVISVVDRFLEHSRIYYFGDARMMYLSSADWMPRNFFSRLEIAFPVLDAHIYRYLEEVLIPTYLGDTVKARELTSRGTWKAREAVAGAAPVRSQFVFEELAAREYKGTPLE
jgi:polyphosphate kinase